LNKVVIGGRKCQTGIFQGEKKLFNSDKIVLVFCVHEINHSEVRVIQ
jgi:hypothetical protein